MQLSSNTKVLIPSRARGIRAFTMVEVALSLAVVAFALVAIIGILPTGMTVQKDNREDTLMNQEIRFWMEAIKNGARGLNDLTNYVEEIRVQPTNNTPASPYPAVFVDNTKAQRLTATEIITLLSVPKFEFIGTTRYTNRTTARVRAITGPATEQSPATNTIQSTFRYQLQTEIVPYYPIPRELIRAQLKNADTNQSPLRFFNESVGSNLWDVRIILRWPVVERGSDWFVGNNRKTLRAQVAGILGTYTNNNTLIERDRLGVLLPNRFDVSAGATPEPPNF
jgi:type II secretory pathway pseudopilin PulG